MYIDVNCLEYNEMKKRFSGVIDPQTRQLAADGFLAFLNQKYIVKPCIDPESVVFVVDGSVSESKLETHCQGRK